MTKEHSNSRGNGSGRIKAHLLPGILLLIMSTHLAADPHALLVGVGDYQDDRIPDLEGPVYDVKALQDVLIDRWQFAPDNIRVLTDRAATEAAVLQGLSDLRDRTEPGDTVLVYFSGHGTSASDDQLGARLNLPDGTGAIVTSEFSPKHLRHNSLSEPVRDGLLVGRHEIRPYLQQLDKDRNVLVIFDACFSGNSARSFRSDDMPRTTRQVDLKSVFLSLFQHDDSQADESAPTEPRQTPDSPGTFEYDNVVYFGAAAEDQLAIEFSQAEIDAGLANTIDGNPHGGFTDALLRVLHDAKAPGNWSFARLFNRAVNEFNIHCAHCGHTPVSLPAIDNDQRSLLARAILTADDSPGTILTNSQAPANQLLVRLDDPLAVPATQTRNATSGAHQSRYSNLSIQWLTTDDSASADVILQAVDGRVQALAADGQLITQFDAFETDTAEAWLSARHWLKQRLQFDTQHEQGLLQVNFRHPLQSNRVTEGDLIHFTIRSEHEAHLLALVMNSAGELSLLYPDNPGEAGQQLLPGRRHRIPAVSDRPIQVVPPWGTDTVLFYALPAVPEITQTLAALAGRGILSLDDPLLNTLQSQLASEQIPYSMRSVRVVATPLD